MTPDLKKPVFDAAKALGAQFKNGADVLAFDKALDAYLDVLNAPIVITASTVPHFDCIKAHLEQEEGRKASAYQDHLGWWTIGVGRLIDARKGGRLSDAEIDLLLANDIKDRIEAIKDWPAWQAVKDNPARATALISMAFQLGTAGLAEFKNSLRLIEQKQWAAAASNLLQSLWARQTPNRAKRVTDMIRSGVC